MCNKIIRHDISLQPKTAVIESDVDEKLRNQTYHGFIMNYGAKWIIDGVKGVCQRLVGIQHERDTIYSI